MYLWFRKFQISWVFLDDSEDLIFLNIHYNICPKLLQKEALN